MRKLISALLLSMAASATAFAGPEDPSRFDGTKYVAQKSVYDFNFERPLDAKVALAYLKNHLKAINEFGDPKNSHLVIVAHGNELHAFSRLNRAAYPGIYEELKALTDAGVTIRVCRNAARSRGYQPDEFYDVITVAPSAVSDLAKWQNEGYSYMYAEWFPRKVREDIVAQYPELQFQKD